METLVKIDIAAMKDGIKKAAEIQKFYKNQRKTVHIKGDRLMSAKEATWQHLANREKLRIMYAAYGLARGKSFVQIEPNSKWEKKYVDSTYAECHPLKKYQYEIDKLLKQYEIQNAE